MNQEFTDEDRELIERHVLLPYALYYLDQDLTTSATWLEKSLIPVLKKTAEQEQFRIRNELRKRRIKVRSEKGWYQADVGGIVNAIEKRMDAEMVRQKVVKLLEEMIKP